MLLFGLIALFAMGLIPGITALIGRILADSFSLGLTSVTILLAVVTWLWYTVHRQDADEWRTITTRYLFGMVVSVIVRFVRFCQRP